MTELTSLGLAEARDALRKGDTTSVALTEAAGGTSAGASSRDLRRHTELCA